jgi:hypothetical protein
VGTGERADFFVIDDGNSVKQAESEAILASTNQWFLEVVPTRLNNAKTGVIINIQQRTNEDDISGTILAKELAYDHLVIRMEYDSAFDKIPTSIGWVDPRKEDGALAWPARFPREVVEDLKWTMGPYASAGQFQQSPEVRGGGIIKREYWQPYEGWKYPEFDFILASLDPAFTEKEANDPSGFTIWGTYTDKEGLRKVLLIWAFRERYKFIGPDIPMEPGERPRDYIRRTSHLWGLVEHVDDQCQRKKVNVLLIENKGPGLSLIQTMETFLRNRRFSVQTYDPKNLGKTARMQRVEPEFAHGMIQVPYKDGGPVDWAAKVIDEMALCPKGRYDDLTDSATAAIYYLRTQGYLEHRDEQFVRKERIMKNYKALPPLYNI